MSLIITIRDIIGLILLSVIVLSFILLIGLIGYCVIENKVKGIISKIKNKRR